MLSTSASSSSSSTSATSTSGFDALATVAQVGSDCFQTTNKPRETLDLIQSGKTAAVEHLNGANRKHTTAVRLKLRLLQDDRRKITKNELRRNQLVPAKMDLAFASFCLVAPTSPDLVVPSLAHSRLAELAAASIPLSPAPQQPQQQRVSPQTQHSISQQQHQHQRSQSHPIPSSRQQPPPLNPHSRTLTQTPIIPPSHQPHPKQQHRQQIPHQQQNVAPPPKQVSTSSIQIQTVPIPPTPTSSIQTMTDPIPPPRPPPKPITREFGVQTDPFIMPSVPPIIPAKRSLSNSDDEMVMDDSPPPKPRGGGFITALAKKGIDDQAKGIKPNQQQPKQMSKPSGLVKSNGKFKTPFKQPDEPAPQPTDTKKSNDPPVDDRLKNIDPAMYEAIMNEVVDGGKDVTWDDIAGLDHAKKTIQEVVVWPMSRPDIFYGIRAPPKGLLLFGPPGTGKTLIGKCIATQSGAKFFSISSSSLTSKWVGDGEKMVRALFAVARVHQPSVIFMDEIDSLLTQRTDGEVESTRRIKTEFLVQFDGCGTSSEDRILLIGATNRPHEIDEAARRRFRKKLYIPLPEPKAREALLSHHLKKERHTLSDQDLVKLVSMTEGYSGSDMDGLVREAALGPIRRLSGSILDIAVKDVPPMTFADFQDALTQVKASVTERDLDLYLKFDAEFGSSAGARV